jgi:hypothetical protein
MNCCGQCAGIERLFDDRLVQGELRDYRKHGPASTTRMLLDALRSQGVAGLSLLDIGGGVGAIQHDLLAAGASHAVHVDAAAAYLHVSQLEAERRGHAERVTYLHGNFVDLAPQIPPVDVVTLDRVLCCYHDMEALVRLSVARARRYYGLVFPHHAWWQRVGRPIFNSYFRLVRNPYRFYLHATPAVEALIAAPGFQRVYYRRTLFWQVVLYANPAASG